MFYQQQVIVKSKSRGFHLITDEIKSQLPHISKIETGLMHLFLQHTSASITINENADPTVRYDMEQHFNRFVPENAPYYQHDYEGPDDMPAHIKSSILGCQLTVPITNGQLALGTWQGIYLGEHRDHASARRLIATIQS
ncbi:secondary thiamine-phosphate synthase enzyme YjbQ [Thalassomonas sp. M1454]|uniref:secondary thiamine-phosphate synthase enzyme YjbQ n=1 Tax=Thalassomonas sp. M1454 TaxID=2594477 RepID=UPI0011816956|nr:secondary thiamine-phosphate synthase enzyme YjbQ [Thalassomonas sp. M1454]TRX55825.1 YjbQ family protein [Thalassomonas sp. M1454]